MYSFIKHILQKYYALKQCGFIKSEKTSVHTSLLIFNNGWTVTSWNRGLTNGLTVQVQVLAPWFTKSTRLYYKWHGIAEIEICSTKNVIAFNAFLVRLCLYSNIQRQSPVQWSTLTSLSSLTTILAFDKLFSFLYISFLWH